MRWPALLIFAASTLHAAADIDERTRDVTFASGVRLHVNAPATLDRAKPTRLIVYATPNGSTIEQTLGCARAQGLHWHFDIQHVAAQVRRLREVSTDENIVLAVTEAPKLSWPAFRQANKDAAAVIRSVIDNAAKDLSAPRITLTGHSGGGSFIFGLINSRDAIPANVD